MCFILTTIQNWNQSLLLPSASCEIRFSSELCWTIEYIAQKLFSLFFFFSILRFISFHFFCWWKVTSIFHSFIHSLLFMYFVLLISNGFIRRIHWIRIGTNWRMIPCITSLPNTKISMFISTSIGFYFNICHVRCGRVLCKLNLIKAKVNWTVEVGKRKNKSKQE